MGQAPLPRNLTAEEKTRLHEIGISRTITDPPDSVVYAPAEFDSVAGIIFAWEAYYTLLTDLIKEVAEEDTAWVVVDNTNEATSASATLSSNGVNMDHVVFQQIPTNSVWIRDYGPWWIYQPDGSRAVLDLVYNRPRPQDDAYPENLAALWNIDYYGLGLVEAGGNMLLDGTGNVFISNIIFDASQGFDPNLTQDQLDEYFLDYFGVENVIITDHLQYDGTGHIDMFVKVINDTTVIVGEYTSSSAGAGNNYNICNNVAAQIAGLTNGNGQPYTVERMLMPPYSGGVTYTYINSLIVNKKVFVPVYGFSTDADVLTQYEQIMPGYEIIGYDCNQIIPANGAIHCIAIKVPAMLFQDSCAQWSQGDVNADDVVDIIDVLIAVDIILNSGEAQPCVYFAADMDEDGNVTFFDVIQILNIIMDL
jgi:agmatine/peptidylarginine deiminase